LGLGRPEYLPPEEYGVAIVDDFMDCGGDIWLIPQTMSLLSLDSYPPFAEAMTAVAVGLLDAVNSSIDDVRIVTAVTVCNSLAEADPETSLYGIDVGSFLRRWIDALRARRSEQVAADMAADAARALDQYEKMVVYERHTHIRYSKMYSGMHIFFPTQQQEGFAGVLNLYYETEPLTNDPLDVSWHRFIAAYGPLIDQCTSAPGKCSLAPTCTCLPEMLRATYTLASGEGNCWACERACLFESDGTCDAEDGGRCPMGTDLADCAPTVPTGPAVTAPPPAPADDSESGLEGARTGGAPIATGMPPLRSFLFTNGTLQNNEGNVLISAMCPSTTVGATVWAGIVDKNGRSNVHAHTAETLWALDATGATIETDASVVDIWWTSAHSVPINYIPNEEASRVSGVWDGISDTLGPPGNKRSSFVFSRGNSFEEVLDGDDSSAEVVASFFEVQYYEPQQVPTSASNGLSVPVDGSGGRRATLRMSYNRSGTGAPRVLQHMLSTKIDDKVERVIPDTAGGYVLPILYGSAQDANGLPIGRPRPYLYRPQQSAMQWGSLLTLDRAPVLEDFGGGHLVSSKEVLMLQAEDMVGQTDTFAGLFDAALGFRAPRNSFWGP
jgi:hypothetical protein